jgi:hypothetical protein
MTNDRQEEQEVRNSGQTLEEEDESEEQENQVPTNILLELGDVNIPMLVIEDIIEEEEQVQQH